MTRIAPIPRAELADREPLFELIEASMGFVPTSMRVMAKWPALLDGFLALSGTVLAGGPLEAEQRHLVTHVASAAAGCEYCQAHTAAHGINAGTDRARYAAVWEFETSDLFSEADRTLLRLAFHAAQQPSAVTDADMASAAEHWTEDQLLHALALVGVFGYLNRFNGALGTTLEPEPLALANDVLAPSGSGWTPGQHG